MKVLLKKSKSYITTFHLGSIGKITGKLTINVTFAIIEMLPTYQQRIFNLSTSVANETTWLRKYFRRDSEGEFISVDLLYE